MSLLAGILDLEVNNLTSIRYIGIVPAALLYNVPFMVNFEVKALPGARQFILLPQIIDFCIALLLDIPAKTKQIILATILGCDYLNKAKGLKLN